jgi:homocysteine S-methyltransferase
VVDAVRLAAQETGKPVVAYPNSGERWNPLARRWEGEPGYDPALARDWIEAGAVYVGGCCRVGPQTIAKLAESATAA